jgi:hypothetical protein
MRSWACSAVGAGSALYGTAHSVGVRPASGSSDSWWGVDNIAAGASESQGQPCGRTVWGTTGGTGVHGLEAGARGSEYIVCTSRNKRHARTDPALEAIAAPIIQGRELREFRVGAAGHHLLCVLEGHADLYLQFCAGCKRWDTCAGEALLRASGGLLTDAAGVPYNYDADQPPLVSAAAVECIAAECIAAMDALPSIDDLLPSIDDFRCTERAWFDSR